MNDLIGIAETITRQLVRDPDGIARITQTDYDICRRALTNGAALVAWPWAVVESGPAGMTLLYDSGTVVRVGPRQP